MSIEATLTRLLAPLRRRVDTMISRVVLRAIDEAHGRQEAQIEGFEGELHPRVEHFQPFGLRARAPVGSEGIGFGIGGSRNHVVVMMLSDKSGPQDLEEGDTVLFCGDPEVFARLSKAGAMRLRANVSWFGELHPQHQYVSMTKEQTTIRVADWENPSRFSLVTITPNQVLIETPDFEVIERP